MVCECQVIVDCFRASDEACRVSGYDRIVGQLFNRVHGIISADVNKCLDVQLVEDIKDFIIYFSVFVDFRQLVAAGS